MLRKGLMTKSALFLFCFVIGLYLRALAHVKVAFFEYRQSNGQIQSIEPGGRLYHVAIQYKDQWMNAHPFYGVQIVDHVQQIGKIYSIIEIDRNIAESDYMAQMGKLFSIQEGWESRKFTYCSKLVGQLLGIQPTLMKSGPGLGLSPDDLYKILKSVPHNEVFSCKALF